MTRSSAALALLLLASAWPAAAYDTAVDKPYDAADRPLAFVAVLALDRGATELISLDYSDGSSETMRLNGGFVAAVGASFLRVPLGRLAVDTVATIGIKYRSIGLDSDTVSYKSFPVDLLERLWFGQVRLAVGVSYVNSPRLEGRGILEPLTIDLKPSLGLQAQFEWIGVRVPGQVGFCMGVRYLWQKLEAEHGTEPVKANAFGFLVGLEY